MASLQHRLINMRLPPAVTVQMRTQRPPPPKRHERQEDALWRRALVLSLRIREFPQRNFQFKNNSSLIRDTISSHEKKRHYLECIEQYILYLHEQFDLVGQ